MTQEEKQTYIDAYNSKNKVVVIAYGYGLDTIKTPEDLDRALNNDTHYVSRYSLRICNLLAYQSMMEFIEAQKSMVLTLDLTIFKESLNYQKRLMSAEFMLKAPTDLNIIRILI